MYVVSADSGFSMSKRVAQSKGKAATCGPGHPTGRRKGKWNSLRIKDLVISNLIGVISLLESAWLGSKSLPAVLSHCEDHLLKQNPTQYSQLL